MRLSQTNFFNTQSIELYESKINIKQQHKNYLWLKNREVIDEIELEDKVKKLDFELGKQNNKISLN